MRARKLVADGGVGELRTIQSFFSYYNVDPTNIRNMAEIGGGGGLMDIGCYCISQSRFIFDAEPTRVFGIVEVNPGFGVDRLAPGQSSLFGSFHGSTASGSDLGSYLFFFGLIATTFLI